MIRDDLDPFPSAQGAERSVVSCCLQSEKAYRGARGNGIDDDCFHFPETKRLYGLCETAERDSEGAVDLVWLVQHLHDSGELQACGGSAGVTEIYQHAFSSHGWSKWLEMLREMKARRLALNASRMLSEASDSEEAIRYAKDALEALQGAVTGAKRAKDANTTLNEFIDRFKRDREAGDLPGHSTGLGMLDAICGGMRDGSLWVVGGQTSRGKSVLMFQIASEFIQSGKRVAIFSLEMMADEIIGRLVTVFGKIDHGQLNQPKTITKGELNQMARAIEILKDGKYWIDDGAGQTIDTIAAEAQRIKDTEGQIDLIVVDYLQLIEGHRGRNETKEQEIARASKGLKQLAKAMGCPVLTGSQLNEEGKTRESRAIAQDADALLYIVDDGIKIGKLRNGKRDDVLPLFLNGKMQVFQEVRQ